MCLKTIATAHSCCVLLSIFAVLQLSQASKKSVKSQSKENDSVSTTGVDTLAQKNSRDYSNLAKAARSAAIIRSSQNMTVSVRKRTRTRLSKDINETATFSSLEELPESMEANAWPTCTYSLYDTNCGFSAGKFEQLTWVSSLSICVYVRTASLNWWDSRKWCWGQNDIKDKPYDIDLATPSSKTNFKLHLGKIRKWRIWTGYDDQSREGCFTSIRKKSRKSKCIPHHWSFWKSSPNDDGGQDCAAGGDDTGYELDDDDCTKAYPHVCSEIRSDSLFMRAAKVTWFGLQLNNIVGDMFDFSFTLSIRAGQSVYISLNEIYDWFINVGESDHVNYINNLLPWENQTVRFWEYDHENKYRRCNAIITIELRLMARREFQQDFHVLYAPSFDTRSATTNRLFTPDSSSYDLFKIGHYFATMIKPQDDRSTIDGEYTFKCMLRLGNDDDTTATLSILNMAQHNNPEYKVDGIQSWMRKYDYKTCSVEKETGTIPPNIRLRAVVCADEDAMGGYHVNVTFQIYGAIGSLHLRTIMCSGDTDISRQNWLPSVEKNVVTHKINIRFPPQTPQLKIISDYPDGVVVAGGKIRAECTAYIGTVSYPQEITWLVYVANRTTPREEWPVHYPQADNLHIPGKRFSGRPGSMKCRDGDWEYKRTGKCVRFVNEVALGLDDAQTYCADQFEYGLLIIDDNGEFMDMINKTGDEGYWIGLDRRGSDGGYRWQDGSDGDPEEWGYWWVPQEWEAESPPTYGSPEGKMCVVLHQDGMEAFDCRTPFPFICQSKTFHVPSYSNFYMNLGPKWTSVVEIDVKDFDSIQDTQLQCKTQRDSTVDEVMKQNGVTEFSNRTVSFRYVYAPLKPKIEKIEQKKDGDFYIDLSCSSVVAKDDGMITWSIRYYNDRATSFWRVKGKGKVTATNGHSRVDVKGIHDEQDTDSGRYMQSNMTIKINGDFHKCIVECYSFDFGTPSRWNISEEDLKDAYYMNLKYLDHIYFWELEEKFGSDFLDQKEDAFRVAGGAYLAKGLLAFISLMFIGVLVLKKDDIAARLGGRGEEGLYKSRGTVIRTSAGRDEDEKDKSIATNFEDEDERVARGTLVDTELVYAGRGSSANNVYAGRGSSANNRGTLVGSQQLDLGQVANVGQRETFG